MRIEVLTAAEFVSELEHEAAGIYRKIVRCRIDEVPEQAERISYQVGLSATALIQGGEAILELAQYCGVDRKGDEAGSKAAAAAREEIAKACGRLGLELRAGKIERF